LGRDVAPVNEHAFLHLHGGFQAIAGFYGQHTIGTYCIQSLGYEAAHQLIVSG
jgi:hypothetical protein